MVGKLSAVEFPQSYVPPDNIQGLLKRSHKKVARKKKDKHGLHNMKLFSLTKKNNLHIMIGLLVPLSSDTATVQIAHSVRPQIS
jgi:hypothetical protein